MLLSQDFSERPRSFPFLHKFALDVGLKKEAAKQLMTKLAYVLEHQGVIEKKAANEAPASLISDEVAKTTKVLNGENPLYIILDTLNSEYDRRDMREKDRNIIQTEIKSLKEKVKQL